MDNASQQFLTPAEAGRALFPSVNGKPVSERTVYRWMLVGISGVKLEYATVGSRRLISAEQVKRFQEAVDAARGRTPGVKAIDRAARRAKAKAALAEHGI